MTAVMVVAPYHLILPPLLLAGLVLAPLLLDELEGLEFVLLKAIVLVAVGTTHHLAAGLNKAHYSQ